MWRTRVRKLLNWDYSMSSRVLNLLVESLTLEKQDGRGFQDACGCLAVRFRL